MSYPCRTVSLVGHLDWSVAWDTVDSRAVPIGNGDAAGLRAWCRSGRLRCPINGCEAPELNTVSGYRRGSTWVADYFRHVRLADEVLHTGESARHWLAKMHVQLWAESVGLVATVERYAHTARRRPDVSIENPAGDDDPTLFVEIQFSPITEQDWQTRDNALGSTGATVLWLWGMARIRAQQALTSAQQACLRQHGHLWFVSATGDEIRLAHAYSEFKSDSQRWSVELSHGTGNALLDWKPTRQLQFGIHGPHDVALAATVANDTLAARAYLLDKVARRLRRHVKSVRLRSQWASRPTRERPPQRRQASRPPNTSPIPTAAIGVPFDRLPSPAPHLQKLVEHEHWTDEDVYRPPQVWKAVVVNEFFTADRQFSADDVERCVRVFANMQHNVFRPVDVFLRFACQQNYLADLAPRLYRVRGLP